MKAPVAVFAYKRTDLLAMTLDCLAKNPEAAESEVFIYCDGPRRPEDAEKVAAARAVARAPRPFGRLHVIERETNLGLARSIKTGVSELCERYGRVIVVEDDLELSPDFLRFMNEALDRYEHEPKVMQVAGHMWDVALPDVKEDALFLSFTTSWGWATWARAWKCYTEDLSEFDRWDAATRRRFDLDGSFPYSRMLQRARTGEIDSWAIWWTYTVFKLSGLVVYPLQSLVTHCGADDDARTHGHAHVPWATVVAGLPKEARWPATPLTHAQQSKVFSALNPQPHQGRMTRGLRTAASLLRRTAGIFPKPHEKQASTSND